MTEEQGGRAAPVRIPAVTDSDLDYYDPPFALPEPPRPRVVVKADLLPSLSAFSFISLLGVPVAFAWSLLAPGERKVVNSKGELVSLPWESYHHYDALAVFLMITLGVGLITGFGMWLLRRRRGPVMMIATGLGSAAAAALAIQLSGLFAGWWYPVPASLQVGDVLLQAPALTLWWAVLAQPTTALLAYGVAAAWNGTDDLGRRFDR
ncbi:DUF2567 domain-containing protein [Allokutzneria sp. NRRL B-24872]|uniref:DUF2567 domain-containing protein n=1 Tax=Allokutzneria sp. NRRL B-24872 TaxID=1137961 RepID=UPI001FEE4006|nr:DUF2567 domain-containing protein [Allokutzneria sp. NRRL B-24872]